MPLRSVPLASLFASLIALMLSAGFVYVDVATDASGQAVDAAARGAVAAPLWLTLLFAVYFGLGRAQVASGKPSYVRAVWLALLVAFALVTVAASASIIYSGDSMASLATYMPWLVGAVILGLLLVPGSLLQAWLLHPRHNTALERTREE